MTIPHGVLPLFLQDDRSASTSIYFLLAAGQFSAFHRIAADEVWHFYFGDPLFVHEINHSGRLVTHRLGTDPGKGESLDRKSTRLNSSHTVISYAVFCLKKKKAE